MKQQHKEIGHLSAADLYQDIVSQGGLNHAMNEALKRVVSKLKADTDGKLAPSYTRIQYKARSSQIAMAVNERLFLVDLWSDGICYGNWRFSDLSQAAAFIKCFVELQFTVKQMKRRYFWFHSDMGKLHEKGPERETKQRWEGLISHLEKEETVLRNLLPCVKIAKEFDELVALFPYTSMNTLCFSLTTGYPYLTVGPKITGWEDYIEIEFNENMSKKIYSAEELKEYMEQNIIYYGTARQGTADWIL